eukprot:422601_1
MAAVNDQQNDDDNKNQSVLVPASKPAPAGPTVAAAVAYTMDDVEQKFFDSHSDINGIFEKIKLGNKQHPLYDLTSNEQEEMCYKMAEYILCSELVDLSKLSESLINIYDFQYFCYNNLRKRDIEKKDLYGLLFFLGFNLARSRLCMLLLKEKNIKTQLTVIVPMWGEHNRMQSKQVHKNGEDFIRRKVKQLTWLYKDIDCRLMDWDLIFVDDGCPNNSGQEAIKLMNNDKKIFTNKIKKKISVEFLIDGLKKIEKFKNDVTLNNVNDSQKGGAVQYGMYCTLNRNVANDIKHCIMYTDADLSTNISQSGLLLIDITINNKRNKRKVIVGDRYAKGIWSDGYIICTFKTNEIALKLRRLFRAQLLPPFKNITDTQCGFKIFKRETIEKVLPKLSSYKGMFDMDLLLKSYDEFVIDDDDDDIIYSTGIVWLASTTESTFDSTCYNA